MFHPLSNKSLQNVELFLPPLLVYPIFSLFRWFLRLFPQHLRQPINLLSKVLILPRQILFLRLVATKLFIDILQQLSKRIFLVDENLENKVVLFGSLTEHLQDFPSRPHKVFRLAHQLLASLRQPHVFLRPVNSNLPDLFA